MTPVPPPSSPAAPSGRHAAPRRRAPGLGPLGRLTALAATATGVVLAASAGSAAAAPRVETGRLDPAQALHATEAALAHAVAPVTELQLNPLANTGSDPLDNSVGTQIADFRPLSTQPLLGPLADGASLSDLPGALLSGQEN